MDPQIGCCAVNKAPQIGVLRALLRVRHDQTVRQLAEQHEFLQAEVDAWWSGGSNVSQRLSVPQIPFTPTLKAVDDNAAFTVPRIVEHNVLYSSQRDSPKLVRFDDVACQTDALEVPLTPRAVRATGFTQQELDQEAKEEAELEEDIKGKRTHLGSGLSVHGTGEVMDIADAPLLSRTALKLCEVSQFSSCKAFVNGSLFAFITTTCIVLNILISLVQIQVRGIDVGREYGYMGTDKEAPDRATEDVFEFVEVAFGLFFTFELVLKVVSLRMEFVHCLFNWLDVFIVGAWLVTFILKQAQADVLQVNPTMLRLCRLCRLAKVLEALGQFKALRMDALFVIIGSIKASLGTFIWSAVFLFIVQTISGLLVCQMVHEVLEDQSQPFSKRTRLYEHFGTVSRSVITMFELAMGNWVPVCRLMVEDVNEICGFFILAYVVFMSFAIFKVISAAFIVETNRVVSDCLELVVLQKEQHNKRLQDNFRHVFAEADDSGDGFVSWEEFKDIIGDKRLTMQLSALDFDANVCEGLFALLDDGDGKISFEEFIKGVKRLKGPAKSIDVVMMSNQQNLLFDSVLKIEKAMEHQIRTIHIAIESLERKVVSG